MVASRPSFFGNVSSMKLFLLSVRRGYVAGFGSSFSYPRVRGSGGGRGRSPLSPRDGRTDGRGRTDKVGWKGRSPTKNKRGVRGSGRPPLIEASAAYGGPTLLGGWAGASRRRGIASNDSNNTYYTLLELF